MLRQDMLDTEKAKASEPKQRQLCKLCSCEGVDGTVLCRDHLDGYKFAMSKLSHSINVKLRIAIEQQKG